MKKAHLLFLALACVMALSGCSVPKKPFRELTGAEIRSASVRLSPPDLTGHRPSGGAFTGCDPL